MEHIKKVNPLKEDLVHENCCIHCHLPRDYNEEYDAYYCKNCNYWLEKICPDKTCDFCKDRPKYPNKEKVYNKIKEIKGKEW